MRRDYERAGLEANVILLDEATDGWGARISRCGRWSWHVVLSKGLIMAGRTDGSAGWIVHGSQDRALRFAHRKIDRWNRKPWLDW